jgi:ribokinase
VTPAAGRAGDIVVVGSINVDLVATVARLPLPGETVGGGRFERHLGGKGGNQAVAAARFGGRVTFVGAVGDDEFGRQSLAGLESEGIDVSRSLTLAGHATGVALIMVDEHGENTIAVAPGANAALSGEVIDETLVDWRPTGPTHPGVVLTSFELSDDAVAAGALFARQLGMEVLLNPAPARPIPAALVELGPILLANEGEARTLSGLDDPEAAARALAVQTGAPVVVTLGPRGALVADGGQVANVPAPDVQVVDTTGAGDTFCGVLAAELACGSELVEAVRFAVVAASLKVAVSGAREGMPSRVAVVRVLESP